jgi:DNA-binding FadR family transcriptional regulator
MEKLPRGPVLNRIIQDQIKLYITENKLGSGDLLPPEGQLANDLGVSRGSVREAIKALESLGIVEVRHGDGVRVRAFNFDSIFDLLSYGLVFDPVKAAEILQIRVWLEVAAVADAIGKIDDGELDKLGALLDRWEAKATRGEDVSSDDRSFHRVLYTPLDNESLIRLIDIFWVIYHGLAVQAIGIDHDPLTTVKAHRELLDAIRARDVALATQRMRDHFRNLEARMARAVQLSQIGDLAPHVKRHTLANN